MLGLSPGVLRGACEIRTNAQPQAGQGAGGGVHAAPRRGDAGRLCLPLSPAMPTNAELVELARKRLYANYKPAPLAIERGKGCELWDADGRRWLDLAPAWRCARSDTAPHPRARAGRAGGERHPRLELLLQRAEHRAGRRALPAHRHGARLLLQLGRRGRTRRCSRPRGTTTGWRGTRSGCASSRSTTPSTAARWARCR